MTTHVFPAAATTSLPIVGTALRFPVNRVFCIGRNYWWSDSVKGQGAPVFPAFFMKPADAVVNASGSIAYPRATEDFCHEIELVVAIGKDGSDIPAETTLDHVWGYGAGLDLTRRDLQATAKRLGQPWEAAKSFDASAPVSALMPASVIGHPSSGAIWLTVNGQERQRSDLAEQIWSVPKLISNLSRSLTLKAGDLVFTGTPEGVGALLPGDVLHAGIDGVQSFSVIIAAR
jgi:fumarylpyruvate hydrolase